MTCRINVSLSIRIMIALRIFCVAICISYCTSTGENATIFVKPTESSECPDSPCYTFSEIVSNHSQHFASNTQLLFLSGTYDVSTDEQLLVTQVSDLVLQGGIGSDNQSISTINCSGSFGLAFAGVSGLTISNLVFLHCGTLFTEQFLEEGRQYLGKIPEHGEYASSALSFIDVTMLNISGVSVIKPKGYGLWAINIMGDSVIEKSLFTNGSCNFQLYYLDSDSPRHFNQHYYITISHSQFTFGDKQNASMQIGSGLNILLLQASYHIHTTIEHCTISDNRADYGANLLLYGIQHTISTVEIVHTLSAYGSSYSGSGLVFRWDGFTLNCAYKWYTILTIENSEFIGNEAEEGSALEVILSSGVARYYYNVSKNYYDESGKYYDCCFYNCGPTVIIKNSSIANNTVVSNDNQDFAAVLSLQSTGLTLLENLVFTHNTHDYSEYGDSTHLSAILNVRNLHPGLANEIVCANCNFSYNTGNSISATESGVVVKAGVDVYYPLIQKLITFVGNTSFHKNIADRGAQVEIFAARVVFYGTVSFRENDYGINFEACNVTFMNVSAVFEDHTEGAISYTTCEIYFQGDASFMNNNSTFKGGAIWCTGSSKFVVQGNLTFENNFAKYGGAIALDARCTIFSTPPTHMKFTNNIAELYGGAIHVNVDSSLVCFLQIQSMTGGFEELVDVKVTFSYNVAGIAGSALFGGLLDSCFLAATPPSVPVSGAEFYPKHVFQIESYDWDLSVISSDPYTVCICENNRPQCDVEDYNMTAYPGELFQVDVITVGQMFGAIPGTAGTEILSPSNGLLPDTYRRQLVAGQCTTVNYLILSSRHEEVLALTADNPTVSLYPKYAEIKRQGIYYYLDYWHRPLNLHVALKLCPVGFELSTEPSQCICAPSLRKAGIDCNIHTQTVQRPANYWIDAFYYENDTADAVFHSHCPYDYCQPESSNLNLNNSDQQCQHNRSGILCGACQDGLSLTLGASQCLHCSNLHLLLIISFALAGIALVSALILSNLTVSVGMINGLIFYANIVRANQEIFLPIETSGGSIYASILTTFIAWLNLDLGIQTCFWDGLDAYGKTWLQFVFPVYIWAIMIIIIVLSHYYVMAAKLSGRNAVPVLATLFLLSYAKLLRIVITALSFTMLEYPDGTTTTVWLYDGNIPYLGGKHIPLFIAALFLLLGLSIPYTLTLLCGQYLQQNSGARILCWVRKFKPLFDAYQGPYKDRHRYWTGLLLIIRAALFFIFSLNSLGDPAINLLAIIAVMLALTVLEVAIGGAYQRLELSILEHSFFLNLTIFSASTLYVRIGNGSQYALAYTSITIALATFLCIIIYQTIILIKDSRYFRQIRDQNVSLNIKSEAESYNSNSGGACAPEQQPLVTVLRFDYNEFREPVLEFCDQNN